MSQEQEITKEEFSSWKDNKVTKAIMVGLSQRQADLKEFLANGGTMNPENGTSVDFIVGRIQGLNEILNVEYEEPAEEKRDAYGH
jgi:ribosome assembly protein YihI (activator of Der GTPase)